MVVRSLAGIVSRVVFLGAIFFLCLLTGRETAYSQTATPRPAGALTTFAHLTIGNGLSQNHITAILQDRQGFMWFGTEDGLNRYNGYEFTIFKADPDDPQTLGGNEINQLIEDRDGFIWVATNDGGVSRFDPISETFTRYEAGPQSLSSNRMMDVAQDLDGNIWLGGWQGGANRLNPTTGQITIYPVSEDQMPGISAVHSLLVDPAGYLWLSGHDLLKVDPTTGQAIRYHPTRPPETTVLVAATRAGDPPPPNSDPPPAPTGGNPPPPPSRPFRNLYQAQNGILWFDSGFILYEFNPQTEQFVSHEFEELVPPVQTIYEDRDGQLWVGTANGLFIYNRQNGEISRPFQFELANPAGLNSNQISAIYQSEDGVLWFGTLNNGLNRLDPRQSQFTNYPAGNLSGNNLNVIYEDPAGALWLAIGRSLNRLDSVTGEVTIYEFDPSQNVEEGPETTNISGIYRDAQGQLWLDGPGGLYALDEGTGQFTRYTPEQGLFSISAMFVAADGQIWLGGLERLYRFDPQSRTFTQFRPGDNQFGFILTIFQDSRAELWLATLTAGLLRFNPQRNEVISYPRRTNEPGAIPAGPIQAIFEDHQEQLWIATTGSLSQYQPQSNTFHHFSQGLPDSPIQSVMADEQGQLWLGTLRGLVRFDPQAGTIRIYDQNDGLLNDSFNPKATFLSRDGRFLFGGPSGLTLFYPEQVIDNPYHPPVILTRLLLFNQPIPISDDSILHRPVWQTEQITLDYDDDFISFEFAALSYAGPEKNRYRYRLEGLEDNWNEVDSSRRFAAYPNLQGGQYTFRVQATNNAGLWSDQEAALKITILLPWWETWWFQGGSLLIGLAITVGLYRWRLGYIERQNQLLESQVAARTQELQESERQLRRAKEMAEAASRVKSEFLANMSHELRTPLNGIMGYAQILQRNPELTKGQRDGLDTIYQSGHHLLTLINDVLDMAKMEVRRLELFPAGFELSPFLDGLVSLMKISAEQKGVKFVYLLEPNLPQFIQADQKRLRQVLLNLLGNAVKFTEKGEVRFQVGGVPAGEQITLHFEIADTGIGISDDKLQTIFQPFEQAGTAHQRAAGVGLGLAISQQLVELMDSQIQVTSRPGQGSTFWFNVTFPVDQPIAVSQQLSTQTISGYRGRRRRILVVDDNANNRRILLELLEPIGFEVVLAENGLEGVEKARQQPHPHLILMDLVMPVMMGFEAVTHIRHIPELANLPIIAVSASVLDIDREHSRRIGCDDFLPKPVEAEKLYALLQKYLHLEWLQDVVKIINESGSKFQELTTTQMVAPPKQELEKLYELARFGNMTRLKQQAVYLENLDAQYRPFANYLYRLADNFDDEAIQTFLNGIIHEQS